MLGARWALLKMEPMAGLCKGNNEPLGSFKINYLVIWWFVLISSVSSWCDFQCSFERTLQMHHTCAHVDAANIKNYIVCKCF